MFATATTQEKTIFTQFYTHKRTREILEAKGIKVRKIEKVSIHKPSGEYYRCVHVVYIVSNGSRCSTFVSCREYLASAIAGRKERSKDYAAHQDTEHPSQWRVVSKVIQLPIAGELAKSGKEGRARIVTTTPEVVICDCEDYELQPSYLQEHPYLWHEVMKQRRVCKHCYTVMDALGYGSLKDYLVVAASNKKLSDQQ